MSKGKPKLKVFDRRFKDVDEPVPREDGAIVFDASRCGVGDVCVTCGFVNALRQQGVPSWIVGDAKREDVKSLLRLFGEGDLRRYDGKGAIELGGRAAYYKEALKVSSRGGSFVETMAEWLRDFAGLESLTWNKNFVGCVEGDESHRDGRPLVLMFPFAAWRTREWPLAKWIDLAWYLHEKDVKVLCVLHEDIRNISRAMPTWIKGLSWEEVGRLMVGSDCVVGNESGPLHVAGALKVKGLGVCGPTGKAIQAWDSVEVVNGPEECRECWFQAERGFRAACDFGCLNMASIDAYDVGERVLKRLGVV